MLKAQKLILLHLCEHNTNEAEAKAIDGIIGLLDEIQDQAYDSLDVPYGGIFFSDDEEDTESEELNMSLDQAVEIVTRAN